ncbi:MAG: quinone-dependent dihydroorotate dehydrogenase [Gammaproteobacteria bacterium]|nr:quinone-dependent dihydroorotate dehydrogenase [Gammaproteobacteria bacterium]
MIYELARDALFRLDPETAHELTLGLFARLPRLSTLPFCRALPQRPVERLGLRFRNPVGLAAGLDKNGECIAAWDRLGFGFVEIGTVTPRPQPGNPQPRLFRLPQHGALINRLGFNNKGVDYLVERVREAPPRGCVLGINIGKNAATPLERAADDYEACLRKVHEVADYVTVNISSPNTRNLRDLQQGDPLRELLARLVRVRAELTQRQGRRAPLLVKVAPDLADEKIGPMADAIRASGVDGLIATNTTIGRAGVESHHLAMETGGLSGRPLKLLAQDVLTKLRRALGAEFPLIGVGGIFDGQDANERRQAGADLIQVYTGFIYRGPGLIRECVAAWGAGR